MKVSFDFDHTLSTYEAQKLAYLLLKAGVEVFVCTARDSNQDKKIATWENADLYRVTDFLGIPRENIIFTGYEDKRPYLEKAGIDVHLDDDNMVITSVNKSNKLKGVHYLRPDWKILMQKVFSDHDKHIEF